MKGMSSVIAGFLLSQGIYAGRSTPQEDGQEYLIISNIYAVYAFVLGIFDFSIIRFHDLEELRFWIEGLICVD